MNHTKYLEGAVFDISIYGGFGILDGKGAEKELLSASNYEITST